MYSLLSAYDVQINLANYCRQQRNVLKLSRDALAAKSTVPASTLKRFETTGEISLRQLCLIWQVLDDLKRLNQLTQPPVKIPRTIEEVLGR